MPWEVHASPHDIADYPDDPFPVVETEIGRLGAAICYDWLFPETLRVLAFKGAEVLVRVSAYLDPWQRLQWIGGPSSTALGRQKIRPAWWPATKVLPWRGTRLSLGQVVQ